MNFKKISTTIFVSLLFAQAFSQNTTQTAKTSIKDPVPSHRFSVGAAYHTFINFGEEKTNTHHNEFHFGYRLTPKDKIGIKVTTWKLFAPMGIPLWDPLLLNESEFFPGRLKESGIGITYQRILWKGLFAAIEILPLKKTYFDENNNKVGDGFKLYTSYHIGYHIPLFNNRMYIEPQIHCNYWPIDTNAPPSFQAEENKWNNYFLFEPNICIGVNF